MADVTTTLDPARMDGPPPGDNPDMLEEGADPTRQTGEHSPGEASARWQALIERQQQQIAASREEFQRLRQEQQQRDAEWRDREARLQAQVHALQEQRRPSEPDARQAPGLTVDEAIQEFDRGNAQALAQYLRQQEQAQEARFRAWQTEEQRRQAEMQRAQQDQQALQVLVGANQHILADSVQVQEVATIYDRLLQDPVNRQYYSTREGDPGVVRSQLGVVNIPLLQQALWRYNQSRAPGAIPGPPAPSNPADPAPSNPADPVTISAGTTTPQRTRPREPGPLFTAQERATFARFVASGAYKDDTGQRFPNEEAALAARWKKWKAAGDPRYLSRVNAWKQGQWHG